jgi:hypothetical protein
MIVKRPRQFNGNKKYSLTPVDAPKENARSVPRTVDNVPARSFYYA